MGRRGIREISNVDEYVGNKIKVRRAEIGITQFALGKMAGVTAQQVQKYELGANRIGAGRLYEFAKILKVRVEYFFDGYELISGTEPAGYENYALEKDIIRLVSEFRGIRDRESVKIILEVVKKFREKETKV